MRRSPDRTGPEMRAWMFAVILASFATAGCGSTPTAPERHGPISIWILCEAGTPPFTTCRAPVFCTLYPCAAGTPTDITTSGTWTSDDPAIVRIAAPGLLEAVSLGDTVVRVALPPVGGELRPVSVFPGTPPLPTWEIAGTVYDGSVTPRVPLDGATVEVLTGIVAGWKAISGVEPPAKPGFPGWSVQFPRGHYEIRGVPSFPYSVRASRPGYVSQEREIPGTSYSLDFVLQRD